MANNVLVVEGTQICFADHGTDFSSGAPATAVNSLIQGTPDTVQWNFEGVLDDAGRESAKKDLGATRAPRYSVDACIEFAIAPTTGTTCDFYWAPSPSSGTTTGNPGLIAGADADASSGAQTMDELILQCQYIGSLVLTADVLNIGHVGVFSPAERYGILIGVNRGAQTTAAAADEIHVVMNPIIDQVQ